MEASNHRPELDQLTDLLCKQETVDGSQIESILGKIEIKPDRFCLGGCSVCPRK